MKKNCKCQRCSKPFYYVSKLNGRDLCNKCYVKEYNYNRGVINEGIINDIKALFIKRKR